MLKRLGKEIKLSLSKGHQYLLYADKDDKKEMNDKPHELRHSMSSFPMPDVPHRSPNTLCVSPNMNL